MAVSPKLIRQRIKSVANTRKITKAMELVAASKMRRAVAATVSSRPYSAMAWSLVGQLSGKVPSDEPHPLLVPRISGTTLAVLFTSDRGLCGGFNAQVMKLAAELAAKRPGVEFIAVGRRGEAWLRRKGLPIVASFEKLLEAPSAAGIRPLARLLTERFLGGHHDEALILYNDYISTIVQKPRTQILLPLRPDVIPAQAGNQSQSEYLFEPDPKTVLNALLPRIVESQLYQAALESVASEHSARMLAMRNANDSASEMLDDLNFTYNQARQAGITREIAEISAGTAAIAG